jgi:pantoate--beta-alanine ligase
MYPKNYATYVEVERLQNGLCGITRPHFFKGVATVVAKLFNAADADRAYFGLKDGQQITIIKRMVRDLDFAVEIVAMPTVREEDGLAMSSRNKYLTAEERQRALCISRALFHAVEEMKKGCIDAEMIEDMVRAQISDVDRIDYISLVDADEMQPVETITGPIMLAVAAFIGDTRLIDNIRFEPSEINAEAIFELLAQEV